MLKIYSCTLVFLAVSILTFSQNAPIDFEVDGNGADWTWTVFENASNPPLEIIANPDPSGINTSATVAKFTALDDGAPFAGCESMHGSDIGAFTLTPATSTITIKVWKSVTSNVGIKLVESTSASLGEILIANTLVDQWEEISFNFSSMEGIEYDQIVIFPDFQDRDSDNIIYFDDITFGDTVPEAEPMAPAPDPTEAEANVISMFSNVYTDVAVNTWLTVWSSAVLTEIQIEGNDTKKYTGLDFAGVETVGDNLIDASEMEFFHMDVWTPNASQLRIKLVDFGADGGFQGGDDTEHEVVFESPAQEEWVSLQISLDDFVGLTNKEHIAQLIISGQPAGTATMYVDNVYFSKEAVVGISDLSKSSFNLYPNPASDVLNLDYDGVVDQMILLDMSGKEIMSWNDKEVNTRIDLTGLPSGMYMLRISNREGITNELFMKE